ncbi:pyridoxal phosphate-dependent aminotransferase [Limosilactobacillus vaginalis]|jgi:cystathionine beta-lyase|uniref:cysteine-S-conjugate beta-lyase n=1 Tax=Limosilactobacillus vaginalis DSM 5837 = ATCC 49540 TaxID=1423814 RepID=C2EUD7_9LACO|nr:MULTISPECIES: MalY/PatB family protein [Limosilactobacillus]PEH04471.1 pyridoxal phosphate-dependent aminotransferase [Lactobacillus sp. UMNPBX5]EEJ40489.1 aminotransferase, class I/II [Limosilactobacillus vaginalis DSM 5837 = ATCC 49540]KRM44434.1 cystathionine beta-lyase [Limosilactobacillus vaginalis DSM 5837 = ATCC 49540]MCI6852792.1 pyridoxal phosphate-dependent aminotransferase [Limosilactobacillus vaginalis]MDM8243726.1 MalY/PatB family protein [Limosilactobacillus vaginalis]
MKYDFDTILDRQHTNSEKWDVKPGELPMTTADMDFKTAPEIMQAMKDKINAGAFGYEYPSQEYFDAVAHWYKIEHNAEAQTSWMRFATGVIPSITASVNHLSHTGDNVLLMEPVYNTFYNSILNSGRHALASQLKYDRSTYTYSVDWDDLEEKMSNPLTTLMILCNPHNPTGYVWSRDELMRIIKLAQKYGVIVISDEIHGDLVLKGPDYTPTFSLPEEYRQNLVTLVSTSKTFNVAALHAATGIVANPILREHFTRAINKYEVAEPNLLAIPGTIAAYTQGADWLHQLKKYLLDNREYLEQFISDNLPQLHVVPGTATYLVWIDVSEVTKDSNALAQKIRQETGLIINPGTYYHGNGNEFIRINIAYPLAQIKDGLTRLAKAIKN